MSNQPGPTPLVIQFSNLADFVEEIHAGGIDVVRVWSGVSDTGAGGQPGSAFHYLNVQAIDPKTGAILSAALFVGHFATIFGKPFGPTAERRREIIVREEPDAKELLIGYLEDELPGVSIRPGAIYTGLGATRIQPAHWTTLEALHDLLAEVASDA